MPSSDPLVEIKGLKTHFFTDEGVIQAVNGVDLLIPRGKTLCVVGESGSGKSITARSIMQIVDYPGRIVDGEILYHRSPDETLNLSKMDPRGRDIRHIRGKDISMIFQEPMSSLSPVHTIGNQIMEVIRLHTGMNKKDARDRAIETLNQVGFPKPEQRIDAYPFQLSGGLRQRAMIAMALANGPSLLIADEPTTALDVTTQANILDLIQELQQEMGMSVMFITHDLGVVAEIADDVAVMYLGTVVEQGSVNEVFHDAKHPYTQALLRSIPTMGIGKQERLASIKGMVPHPFSRPSGCPFHTRCDHHMPGICNEITPPIEHIGDRREVRCLLYSDLQKFGKEAASLQTKTTLETIPMIPISKASEALVNVEQGSPLLEINNLKMHFPVTKGLLRRVVGHVKAVDDVSFVVYEGETLGLVGESGCGKTTLGRCILRIYRATDGQISYQSPGKTKIEPLKLNSRQLKPYWRDVRMIFQDPQSSLNPRLPVLEIIGESLKANNLANGKELERRVIELLRKVGLRPEYLRRYPHAFSGGERQRIGIARAIAVNPRMIVADEAVSALDVSVRAQILNLLKDLQEEFELTFVFVSHDLSVVEYLCDRVAVMYVGKIVELAATEAIYQNPRHPYTEALLSAVPKPDPSQRDKGRRIRLQGEVADPANPPTGCYFHPRCRYSDGKRCKTEAPPLREIEPGQFVACHYSETLDLKGV